MGVRRSRLSLAVQAVVLVVAAQLAACSDSVMQPTAPPHASPATHRADVIPGAPNLIVNGSFEPPLTPTSPHEPGWLTYCQGNTSITGWAISGTDCVDVHWGEHSTHWTNIPDGQQALDLNGSGTGAVLTQTVAGTQGGKKYKLSIDVSNNPAGPPPPTITADIRFGGVLVATVVRSSANSPISNMTWDHHDYIVTAPSDNADLSFTATSFTCCGIVLDNIQLVAYDDTPPTITYSPSDASFAIDETVAITCTATDDDSGVNTTDCANVNAPAYTFSVGTHTLSSTATDFAGNLGKGSTTFTVTVSQTSLCSLVTSFVSNAGEANSLCVKLKQKSSKAFVNEVNAQTGKAVPSDKAPILISLAQALLDN